MSPLRRRHYLPFLTSKRAEIRLPVLPVFYQGLGGARHTCEAFFPLATRHQDGRSVSILLCCSILWIISILLKLRLGTLVVRLTPARLASSRHRGFSMPALVIIHQMQSCCRFSSPLGFAWTLPRNNDVRDGLIMECCDYFDLSSQSA